MRTRYLDLLRCQIKVLLDNSFTDDNAAIQFKMRLDDFADCLALPMAFGRSLAG